MKKYDYPLPPGTSINGMTGFDYTEAVFAARIEKSAKYLLLLYAHRYNFKQQRGCFSTSRRNENHLCIARGTYSAWKQYLVDLGWIQVKHRPDSSDVIVVRIGRDDPAIAAKYPLLPGGSDDFESWIFDDQA